MTPPFDSTSAAMAPLTGPPVTNANAAAALRARRWIGDDAAPWVPGLLPALVGVGASLQSPWREAHVALVIER